MKNYILMLLMIFTLALLVPVKSSPQVLNPSGIHLATLPATLCPDQPALIQYTELVPPSSCRMPAWVSNDHLPTIARFEEGLYPLKYIADCVISDNLRLNWYLFYIPATVSILSGPSMRILLPGDKMHRCCTC